MSEEQEKKVDFEEKESVSAPTPMTQDRMAPAEEISLLSENMPMDDTTEIFLQESAMSPVRPMSYRDESAADAAYAAPSQPPQEELTEEDFLFPPYAELKRPKRLLVLKSLLWVVSVLLVSMAIFFAYRMILPMQSANKNSTDERIPYNQTTTSYAEEFSLPDAPEASADPNGPQISVVEESAASEENAASKAYRKAAASVVCVTSYRSGSDYVLDKIGDGSGIVLSEDGYIATNSHVLDNNVSTGVMVTTHDGTQYLGTIIGVDKKTDLAVLKIDADNLTPAEFADSGQVFVGQEVYAIGCPGGANFSNSLTTGCVSAVNRTLLTNAYVKYIQTDTAINPGNSGGPLINERGFVIGMNTSKIVSTNYEGMSFSVPSNKVVEIVNKLIRYGYINDRATIGIEGTTCNLYESKLKNVPQGMVITKIDADSPLKKVDVKEQDIITGIDGIRIKSAYEFIDALGRYRPGDTVMLSVFRASKNPNQLPQRFNVELQLSDDANQ